MIQYRFLTPRRRGKWYSTLGQAQAAANRIGAGFLDPGGTFVPYRGTVLEMREKTRPAIETEAPASGASA